jgi:peptide/nickel transport system permease protein
MIAFVIRRFLQSIMVLFATAVIVFVGLYAIGNPIDLLLAPDSTAAERAQVERELGLDQPLPVQFLTFLGNIADGDFGQSFVFNQPAVDLIADRLPATIELAASSLILALIVGIPLGILAGLKPNTVVDEGIMMLSIFGFSLPKFWQGIMLIMIFSVWLGWLPSTGREAGDTGWGFRSSYTSWEGFKCLILPTINLSLFNLSLVIRLTRTGVRETMLLEFVKFARAKGLRERRIVLVHVLKVISIPLITIIGMEIGNLIAFSIVTETIFAWPGVGKLLIDSIMRLDRPVIVAYLLIVVALFIAINFIVDICYSLLDPRIRLENS